MSEQYKRFISKIKHKLGIDLHLYKEAQMKRRLTSLRNKREFNSFDDYFNALDKDKELLKEFVDRITINVSEFYRNPKRWDVLVQSVIPYLAKSKKKLNIWSAACSTGEEPYSLAIAMKEHFPSVSFQITATDIDANVLKRAKEGVYQEKSLKDLPIPFMKKYFTEKNNLFYIDPTLKNNIDFKIHNLLADPYPSNIDLLVCRNVLIYFTDEAKDTIYKRFSKSLVPHGILFVGSTEQIFKPDDYDLKTFDTFFYEKT